MYLCVCCVYRHTLTDTQREREEEEEKHLYGTTFSRILFPTLFWLIVGHTRHFAWEFSRSYGSHSESHFGDSRVWCMSTLRITALLVHQLCRTAEPGAARVPSGACLGSSQSWAHTWLASWGTRHLPRQAPCTIKSKAGRKAGFQLIRVGFSLPLISVCVQLPFSRADPADFRAHSTGHRLLSQRPPSTVCQIKPLIGRRGTVALDFEPVALVRNMDRRIGVSNNRSHGLAI